MFRACFTMLSKVVIRAQRAGLDRTAACCSLDCLKCTKQENGIALWTVFEACYFNCHEIHVELSQRYNAQCSNLANEAKSWLCRRVCAFPWLARALLCWLLYRTPRLRGKAKWKLFMRVNYEILSSVQRSFLQSLSCYHTVLLGLLSPCESGFW